MPITHVTNGAHLPTFLSRPARELLNRHLGNGWLERAADPRTWEPVRWIPDAELWEARCAARADLISYLRRRSVVDRLHAAKIPDFAISAADTLDAGSLTLGFARRLATYKRVHLLVHDPARAVRLLTGDPPVQSRSRARPTHATSKGGPRSRASSRSRGSRPRWRGVQSCSRTTTCGGPTARRGLRRLDQPTAPADGSKWHERDEVGLQRRLAAKRARRLVGGGL